MPPPEAPTIPITPPIEPPRAMPPPGETTPPATAPTPKADVESPTDTGIDSDSSAGLPDSEPSDRQSPSEPPGEPVEDSAETTHAPETITPQTQMQEVQTVASNMLFRKMKAIQEETRGKTAAELDEMLQTDPGKAELATLAHLATTVNVINLEEQGNSLTITTPEGNVTITHITGGTNDTLTCMAELADGRVLENYPVNRSVLLQAHVRFAQERLQTQFSADERVVFDAYVQTLTTSTPHFPEPGSAEATALNESLLKAAESSGILTIKHARGFIESHTNSSLRRATDDEKPRIEAQAQAALAALDGHNILNYDTAHAMFGALGVDTRGNFRDLHTKARLALESLKKDGVRTQEGRRAATKREIEEAKDHAELTKMMAERFAGETDPLKSYFDDITAGVSDLETARAFGQAFATGNIEQIVQTAFPDVADNATQNRKNQQQREKLLGIAAKGGLGLAGGMFLLMMLSSSFFKQQ